MNNEGLTSVPLSIIHYQLSIFIMLSTTNDTYFMQQAFIEARKAFDAGEVPVGAVI